MPFKIDWEIAYGTVIGPENCSSIPSKNAWLIQLTRRIAGPSGKMLGNDITYNNVKYSNVVKTYNLPDIFKTPEKSYSIEFYLEANVNKQQCDVQNPDNIDILNILIKTISNYTLVN